jgi:hypothetical protein
VLEYSDADIDPLTVYTYYVVAVSDEETVSPNSNEVELSYSVTEDELLATYTYNIRSWVEAGTTVAALKAAGFHITGASIGGLLAADKLRFRANLAGTYIAWSRWSVPNVVGGNPNTGSTAILHVVHGATPTTVNSVGPTYSYYDGYAAARAAFIAGEPYEVTGSTEYWIGVYDSPIYDNSGGLSVTVEVWGQRP